VALPVTIEFAINYLPSREVQSDIVIELFRIGGIRNVTFSEHDGLRLNITHVNENLSLTEIILRSHLRTYYPSLLENY